MREEMLNAQCAIFKAQGIGDRELGIYRELGGQVQGFSWAVGTVLVRGGRGMAVR